MFGGMEHYRRRAWAITSLVCWLLLSPGVTLAANAIAQSYSTTSTSIAPGTLLSLVQSGSSQVEPAHSNGSSTTPLVGVATTKPLLELSTSGEKSVQVAVGGTAQALVSDINGPVAAGDKIAASPIAGIGMRAVSSAEIVGSAQAGLSTVHTVTQTIDDKTGKAVTVKVGLIPLAVSVGYYSASSGGTLGAFIPPILQNLANTISGKAVSPLRVLISLLTLLLGSITVIVMLNTAIHSGIISLGRNPLAGSALRKGLVDVILAALGVLAVTFVIVYAILTK